MTTDHDTSSEKRPHRLQRWREGAYAQRLGRGWGLFLFVLVTQLILAGRYFITEADLNAGQALGQMLQTVLASVGWGALLWGLVSLARGKGLRAILAVCAVLLSLGFYLYEFVLVGMYHVLYNTDVAEIMLSTTQSESGEFLTTVLRHPVLYEGLIGLALTGVACWVAQRHPLRASKASVLWGVSLVGGLIVPLIWQPLRMTDPDQREVIHPSTSFERLIYYTRNGIVDLRKFEKQMQIIDSHQRRVQELSVQSPWREPVQVVLVLGESARRDYMHAYGYELPNTPHLDSLVAGGEVALYTNVVSPAPSTIPSNTRSLTFYTNERKKEKWYNYPSILTTLSAAGYATAWVTNQPVRGLFSMVNVLGRYADLLTGNPVLFSAPSGERIPNRPDLYDEAILGKLYQYDQLPDSLRRVRPRGLFEVVHLMGSHVSYAERYPEPFERFRAENLPVKKGGYKDEVIASYVNSLYYTDYILGEIIRRYQDTPAIVIYMSDHGDGIYDASAPNFNGHTLKPEGVSIPFFVYFSPLMRAAYPRLWHQILAGRDARIMTDLFTHALTGLLGVKTEYSEPKYEFFSPRYDASRRRRVSAGISASYMDI